MLHQSEQTLTEILQILIFTQIVGDWTKGRINAKWQMYARTQMKVLTKLQMYSFMNIEQSGNYMNV